jgi:streptomycin 6-kinase
VLLERATGKRSLAAMAKTSQDDEATAILCDVAANLHAPRSNDAPARWIPLGAWFEQLEPAASRQGGIFADALVAARGLLAGPCDDVVLHGDLHHDNVLDGESRGWLAIDPKGLIGDRAFDYATVFCNPDPATAMQPDRIRRQVALIADHARIAPSRLLRWLLAYAGLAAAGCMRDGFDPAPALAIAQIAKAER